MDRGSNRVNWTTPLINRSKRSIHSHHQPKEALTTFAKRILMDFRLLAAIVLPAHFAVETMMLLGLGPLLILHPFLESILRQPTDICVIAWDSTYR
jgi:hypothetical protein